MMRSTPIDVRDEQLHFVIVRFARTKEIIIHVPPLLTRRVFVCCDTCIGVQQPQVPYYLTLFNLAICLFFIGFTSVGQVHTSMAATCCSWYVCSTHTHTFCLSRTLTCTCAHPLLSGEDIHNVVLIVVVVVVPHSCQQQSRHCERQEQDSRRARRGCE